MSTRGSDELDKLAELVGTTRRELVRAFVRASHRDWLRVLRRELRKMGELFDDDDDLFNGEV